MEPLPSWFALSEWEFYGNFEFLEVSSPYGRIPLTDKVNFCVLC
jgi:hypothetical protein